MSTIRRCLNRLRDDPTLNLLAASILLVSTLLELTDSTFLGMGIGARHGLLIFSTFHILKCIPDLLEAIDFAVREQG